MLLLSLFYATSYGAALDNFWSVLLCVSLIDDPTPLILPLSVLLEIRLRFNGGTMRDGWFTLPYRLLVDAEFAEASRLELSLFTPTSPVWSTLDWLKDAENLSFMVLLVGL